LEERIWWHKDGLLASKQKMFCIKKFKGNKTNILGEVIYQQNVVVCKVPDFEQLHLLN